MDTTPRRVEHQQTDKGYVPVYTTAVIEQPWDGYSADDTPPGARCTAASANCWWAAPAASSSTRRTRWA